MKIISLLGEASSENKASLPIDKDLLYKARQKYPQYSGEQALTLYIADEMAEKQKVDSNQNKLIDTQKRENERLRGAVQSLGQELQDFEQQSQETDREVERLKQISGRLSQGDSNTRREAKVSTDDLHKLEKELEALKAKPGIDTEKVKQLEAQIKQVANNPSFDNSELNRVEHIVKSFNTKQVVSDDLYQKAFDALERTQQALDKKEERFKNYISKTGETVRTSSEEIKKYSDIVNSYKSKIGDIDNELDKMKSEKDIIYNLRAGIQQDAEDINTMKIDISQSLDFINQNIEKMTNAEPAAPNKKVADINWLVGGNQKPQNTPNTSHIQEGYDVTPSRKYNNSKYSEWITKHLPGLFSMFKGRYATELEEKGYSDKQIADTLEEYVPLLYNLGDDKTPLTPQQVKLWIDNVKKKLWERPVQYEMFNESLDKTYTRMLDNIISLAYIKKG
jgi:predicted  nucleic acid-binding Zn-ribbon protein